MPDTFWDTEFLARRWNKPPGQILKLAREGIIPCVRIGRSVRFSPEQIYEWERNGGQAWGGGWRKEA